MPPVEATVACQDALHRLGWAGGELMALDHDDVDGELVLGALGGRPAVCAQVVGAWRQAADDLRVLVLASRGPADPLATAEDPLWSPTVPSGQAVAISQFGWYAYAPLSGSTHRPGQPRWQMGGPNDGEPDADQLLAGLLALGGGLPERLVATVVGSWTDRLAAGTAPTAAVPALTAALSARAGAAVRAWRHDPRAEVTVALLAPGSPPTLRTDRDGVRLALPFSWLAEVWVPGLAVLLDRFTLSAAVDGPRLVLDTLGGRADRQQLVVTRVE